MVDSRLHGWWNQSVPLTSMHLRLMQLCPTVEIIGWVGRMQSASDPFSSNAFVMQIVTLVIAPAWLSAGCYQVTGSLVHPLHLNPYKRLNSLQIYRIGRLGSPLSARAYTIIFVLCDVVSIMLQSAGGAAAGNDAKAGRSPDKGRSLLVSSRVFPVQQLTQCFSACRCFFPTWCNDHISWPIPSVLRTTVVGV